MFQVPFKVPPLPDNILQLISVRNAYHVLFDDQTLIQASSHIMACRSDQLDTSFVRSMVAAGTAERG